MIYAFIFITVKFLPVASYGLIVAQKPLKVNRFLKRDILRNTALNFYDTDNPHDRGFARTKKFFDMYQAKRSKILSAVYTKIESSVYILEVVCYNVFSEHAICMDLRGLKYAKSQHDRYNGS